jgi:signal-induced proliferation-associated 1 like protein 3
VLPVPVPPLPVLPVPVLPVPVLPVLPEPAPLLPPPPPTGAAPPVAEETGMVVVGVVGVVGAVGVVVVVVVVEPGAGVLVPAGGGVEGPVPTTVRVEAGVEPPLCGDCALAAMAFTDDAGASPLETCDTPLG